MNEVVFGTVKFVNPEKGFGFIRLDAGAGDVHFYLDHGVVPAAGWKAQPMPKKALGERHRLRLVCPPAPRRGDRVALEAYEEMPRSGRSSKGPSATWWGQQAAWLAARAEIEARALKYPVGLYYWPWASVPGGRVEQVSYLQPGQRKTHTVGYDYDRVPAHWAVVREAGELPHESFSRHPEDPAEWHEYVSPDDLKHFPVVFGSEAYVEALRAQVAEYRKIVGEYVEYAERPPSLELDDAGNGVVTSRDVRLEIRSGRFTTGDKRGAPYGNHLDSDDDDSGVAAWFQVVGGLDRDEIRRRGGAGLFDLADTVISHARRRFDDGEEPSLWQLIEKQAADRAVYFAALADKLEAQAARLGADPSSASWYGS